MDTKQAANHKLAVSSDQLQPLPLPQTQPKAPPPDSSAMLADHQNASAECQTREPITAHNASQPSHDCADIASDRQAAVHTEHDARTSATKPTSIRHAVEEVPAAAAASPGVPHPEQDHSSHVAHTAAVHQTLPADTDASRSMPASSPAIAPTSGVAATAPNTIKQSQSATSGADIAASDSRPSFLSMLQSKMERQRQQRRESQSAGSASESSLSSVHAAGASSVEKAGPSVDSGASLLDC